MVHGPHDVGVSGIGRFQEGEEHGKDSPGYLVSLPLIPAEEAREFVHQEIVVQVAVYSGQEDEKPLLALLVLAAHPVEQDEEIQLLPGRPRPVLRGKILLSRL